jgi:ABC-type multidrug transport system fused ATPase/permease subunit
MFALLTYFPYLRFALVSTILLGLITLTVPLEIGIEPGLGKMIFEKIFVTFDPYLLYKYLGIQVFLLVFNCALELLFAIHHAKIWASVSNAIQEKILKRLFHSKMMFFHDHDSGFIMKRIAEDSQAIASGISSTITILCNIVIIVGIGGVLYLIEDWICYSYCAFLVVSALWVPLWLRPIYKYNEKIGELYSDMYSYYLQVLPGIKEIKTNNLYRSIGRKIITLSKKMKRANVIVTVFYSLLYQLAFFFPMALYATLLIVGLAKIESGEFTIGLLLGLFSILWFVYQPVQNIFSTIDTVQLGITASKRMDALRNAAQEKTGKIKLVDFKTSIEFKNVVFGYDGKNNVLENIDLTVKKGQKIAFVGATGSGKTTILQLLLNLLDGYTGEIAVDGIQLHDYTMKTLREKVVFITQDIHVFKNTIRSNIDLKNNLTDDKVAEILKKVNLHELVASLPDGMYTKIGDDGYTLSGGEQQRVSLARCFAINPEIILLDEISSSLDPENEQRVIAELERYAKDKTVISVSHKMSVIKKYDQIFVLKKGKIVERGTHEELSEKNGEYCSLFNIQANKDS